MAALGLSLLLGAAAGQTCSNCSGRLPLAQHRPAWYNHTHAHAQGSVPRTILMRGIDGNGLCLDVPSGIAQPGNLVQLWECNGHTSQLWLFDEGAWKIQYAQQPDQCLDAGDMKEGTLLKLWPCNQMSQQKWGYDWQTGTIFLSDSRKDASLCADALAPLQQGNSVQVWGCNDYPQQQFNVFWGTTIRVNQDYYFCLDLLGGQAVKGTAVQTWECNSYPNQQWVFNPSTGQVVYGGNGLNPPLCLDAHDMSAGTKLLVWDCDEQLAAQQWGFDAQQQTLYLAKSFKDASMCMDLDGGQWARGTQVQAWGCNDCWNQQWVLGGGVVQSSGPVGDPARPRGLSASASPNSCPAIPSPPKPPEPAGKCKGGWPQFSDAAAVTASPWAKYFDTVYGGVPQDGYPMCMGDFWMFYNSELRSAGVSDAPKSVGECPDPKHEGERYDVNNNLSPAGVSWNWHPPPRKAFSDNTWVEVIHTQVTSDEKNGAWFYYAKGSGMWFNLGKTISFPDHAEAYAHFHVHNVAANGGPVNEHMCVAAAKAGYDSIQFVSHPYSSKCSKKKGLSSMNYELVSTKLVGAYTCTSKSGNDPTIAVGWNGANGPCECDNGKKMLNCKGVPE